MRAAHDFDGGHAAHAGLRVLARLRVCRGHNQQLTRQRQARGLGRWGQQPVVANALEARRQDMLQEAVDELLGVHADVHRGQRIELVRQREHQLLGPGTVVGIENPGYPDARNNFLLRTRHVRALRVDAQGLVLGAALAGCRYVYVTPSHQCPTTVTMPLQRRLDLLLRAERDDFIVIEDEHESELNFSGQPTPALKSLDSQARVIYLGSLSKTLAHGLRLGYVVAAAELIRELRALRRLVMRHVPTNNQQAAASFIGHGHQEAFVRRLNIAYRERAHALRTALALHAPGLTPLLAQGGSALWVSAGKGTDTRELSARLYRQGVVVEPGDVFFAGARQPRHHMRIGYSSIPVERIEAGVRVIGRELAAMRRAQGVQGLRR